MTEEQKHQIGEIIFRKHNGFLAPNILAKYVGYTEQEWLDILVDDKTSHNAKIDEQISILEGQKIK